MKNKAYRPELDGLRAIAVISVIIYHLNPKLLPGGFVGVDIFFVISGFLISTHILSEVRRSNTFSFQGFYMRRIKRLLPALLFMNLMALCLGYFVLTNFYFQSLGEQAYSANLSYSNIFFYLTAGYFDIDATLKPLLHTWSLGVEEQFYLIWPILIISFYFFTKKFNHFLYFFIFLFIISFVLNGIYYIDSKAIFYLMPFRVFEFSAGAVIAYLILNEDKKIFADRPRAKNCISVIALIAITFSMLCLNEKSVFPYYNALPVIFGCMCLIYFRDNAVNRFLSVKYVVFIGLISYSLYLYHWPVIFFVKYVFSGLPNSLLYFFSISVTLILSIFSYYFIERPFRFKKSNLIIVLFSALIITVLVTSSFIKMKKVESFNFKGEIINKSNSQIFTEQNAFIQQQACRIDRLDIAKKCNWAANSQILFFGNSHNLNSYNIFYSLLGEIAKYNLIYPGDAGTCIGINMSIVRDDQRCKYGVEQLQLDDFIQSVDILVVNFFDVKKLGAQYISTINKMRKLNPTLKIIYIGGFIGTRPHNCRELINKYESLDICSNDKFVSYWGEDDRQWLLSQSFAKDNFLYVDTALLLCGERKELKNCVTRVEKDLIFYDGDHFSLFGSKHLGNLIKMNYKEQFRDFGIYIP